MTITVASRKAKGRRLQQWVARKISEVTGFACGTDCEIESRPMGQTGPDVRLEKKVLKIFPFSIECKAQESWSIHSWIKQAESNIYPDTDWLLVMKKSRHEPLVLLRAELFFQLLDELNTLKGIKNVSQTKD